VTSLKPPKPDPTPKYGVNGGEVAHIIRVLMGVRKSAEEVLDFKRLIRDVTNGTSKKENLLAVQLHIGLLQTHDMMTRRVGYSG
jgi:hypothetical protein